MEARTQINVPYRPGGKKMRKRRELDALIAHSLAKRNLSRRSNEGLFLQDKLMSASTDDPDDYTLPKVYHSSTRRGRKYIFFRVCGPLIFMTSFALLFVFMYWYYFDLRQQIYDNRQKIEEAYTTSQNLPETMQQWHETSTLLLKNQTVIFKRIEDFKRLLESLQNNCTNLENKSHYINDEKIVANFGARIEAIATDLEGIRTHYKTLAEQQETLKMNFAELKSNVTNILKLVLEKYTNITKPITYEPSTNTTILNDLKEVTTESSVNKTIEQLSNALEHK
ncbi:uncharacterized protein LOC119685099 [Teleopsis dalmanni]|uniref:uncharacterized protein LOC119684899 n=1 Tax=Teleopsis dalmanni TaxID=139649 RepID=UPI000D32961A|nr:uncharacterized protein LOC119684899 [Teleopsis dalmanni]XP_037954960.1 uncharacterized protein LOC119684899 [Teleopsis dalmanni]XP_037954961.1 uncharacterized protein LOC119684899 [Teleopsis dalmanni]XP_037954962.1 uncharacterized protein LOC119684899 [Teleopsis dalmanni]XP_037955226.1 uncharacterized protein LOC119685099 [Teleopsis dalmanni]XP_037955227.1 uncharacterized protein LOC119685099 [Teleopsis dalmanni]XP_037955228.1 uncharacterized protein LOC119685099 [Teleopsis dalmanni]XP_0